MNHPGNKTNHQVTPIYERVLRKVSVIIYLTLLVLATTLVGGLTGRSIGVFSAPRPDEIHTDIIHGMHVDESDGDFRVRSRALPGWISVAHGCYESGGVCSGFGSGAIEEAPVNLDRDSCGWVISGNSWLNILSPFLRLPGRVVFSLPPVGSFGNEREFGIRQDSPFIPIFRAIPAHTFGALGMVRRRQYCMEAVKGGDSTAKVRDLVFQPEHRTRWVRRINFSNIDPSHSEPWALGEDELGLGSISLPLSLFKCASGIRTADDDRNQSSDLHHKANTLPLGVLWALCILGCVIIACGWWNSNRNLNVGIGWWLLLTLAGCAMLAYGFGQILERGDEVAKDLHDNATDYSLRRAFRRSLICPQVRAVGGAFPLKANFFARVETKRKRVPDEWRDEQASISEICMLAEGKVKRVKGRARVMPREDATKASSTCQAAPPVHDGRLAAAGKDV